jgi:anti-anti-sigma factor
MNSPTDFTSRFQIDDATRIVTVTLTGNFDPVAVDDLHPQVQELVRAGYQKFIFDIAGLTHIGSLGLRLLVGLHQQLKGTGAAVLCSVPGRIQAILDLTKVHQVLRTYATPADAADAIRS